MKIKELMACDDGIFIHSDENSFDEVRGITTLEFSKPGHLLFINSSKYWKKLEQNLKNPLFSEMGLIVDEKLIKKLEQDPIWEDAKKRFSTILGTSHFEKSMCLLSKVFFDETFKNVDLVVDGREDDSAQIDASAKLAANVFIGQNVVLGKNVTIMNGVSIMAGSKVGDDTVIFPSVTVYPGVVIRKRCRIHSSTTLGTDGFGYNFIEGVHHKLWHFGGLIIDDDVEIGANSAIDGGTFSPTMIGAGSKIDNHVQIGHNCILGRGVILCGQVGISGSCTIDDYALFAGKAGMGQGINIGKGVQVAGGALVSQDWAAGSVIAGHPARPLKEWLKGIAHVRKNSLKTGNQ
ncbi:MAG: UDP-3-O-(3-hydroxymyristoyl)glucosamine N-acyltransferase [Epsilonproteobacteria bacterium]|nr:MAG: UDP-3-O-(3-hydroxymyristoyl)glucosamine N-acyltransferase [Campylobacterota bacterium]RLA66708.1 MAG: UDP-3-O-(3-hydroxymyristoyl)glucosamine N-acyltransferase [Campylobacterota bacterium]